jgi:alpha-galactosidase
MFTIDKQNKYTRLKLDIHPKQDITIQNLEIQIKSNIPPSVKAFCNGYQSWSESRLFSFDEQPDKLKWFGKLFIGNYYGDNHIPFIPSKKGNLHSWTYSYLTTDKLDNIDFIGSLNETTAFTCILYNIGNQTITLKKDIENLQLAHSFPAFDILMMSGDTPSVFDTFFELSDIKKPKLEPLIGWTSWYNHFNKINESLVLDNLDAYAEKKLPLNVFLIDDGWQRNVGDWLTTSTGFSKGMSYIAYTIHQQGIKAGLWLAPFIVEKKSKIFTEKNDWLLKDAHGQPVVVGYSPYWSGKFFALDFYNKEVQEYLSGILHTVVNKWSFDVLKLDFLYAVCTLPRPNKTRAQIMHDAMLFLRQLCGDKILMASGVPLGSAFGITDFCRVSSDIHMKWEHGLAKFIGHRERASTLSALRSVLNRWQLNGLAFQNDPDAFVLRKDNHKLTEYQKETIGIVNALLGKALFTSDNIREYDTEATEKYYALLQLQNNQIEHVELRGEDVYVIYFKNDNQKQICCVNLSNIPVTVEGLKLAPYQSLINDC